MNHYIFTLLLISLLLVSCKKDKKKTISAKTVPVSTYTISITSTSKNNAPALQSFTHGVSGSDWLLFAGRTNKTDSIGGLHDLQGNYTSTSFLRKSFNDSISVYNVSNDTKISISLQQLVTSVRTKSSSPKLITALNKNLKVFKNTNALVRQVGDYLYIVGGYGPKQFNVKNDDYITYNHVAKINVPSMIKIVKGSTLTASEWKNVMSFGKNTSLISTGGELYHLGTTFYLVTGHNFTTSSQKYVDAVYPFKITTSATNSHELNISVSTPITDVDNPTDKVSDNISVFRRRDGPIVPAIYKSPVTGSLEEGISIYAGVFKPGEDLQAWNDAIYIHPKWIGENSRVYTYDKAYNQNNYSVYACPDVVAYDATSGILHTFLLGGIGDGESNTSEPMFGFTNAGVHIQTNVNNEPLTSTSVKLSNVFNGGASTYYGAEAILFPNKSLTYNTTSSEIISTKNSFSGTTKVINVGYIFGGIEALEKNPGTFGYKKSLASNKIWKVTLTKN